MSRSAAISYYAKLKFRRLVFRSRTVLPTAETQAKRQLGHGFLDRFLAPRSTSVPGADLPAAGPLGGAIRTTAAQPCRRLGGGCTGRPVAGRPGCDRNRTFPLHQWAGRACPPAPAA